MSVENAKKFLEYIATNNSLKDLLEHVSMQDLEQALEENRLDEVTGGIGLCIPIAWN